MAMRKHRLPRFSPPFLTPRRINDLTVPYLTACIELEDPFADYENTGLTV